MPVPDCRPAAKVHKKWGVKSLLVFLQPSLFFFIADGQVRRIATYPAGPQSAIAAHRQAGLSAADAVCRRQAIRRRPVSGHSPVLDTEAVPATTGTAFPKIGIVSTKILIVFPITILVFPICACRKSTRGTASPYMQGQARPKQATPTARSLLPQIPRAASARRHTRHT